MADPLVLADLLDLGGDAGADLQHEDNAPATPEPPPQPAQLVPMVGGGQMTRRQQVFAAVAQAFRQARRNWEAAKKRPGGPIHWFENYHAESVAETFAYRDSRAWVPAGHEGGSAEQIGTFYYSVIAPWFKRFFLFGNWVVERLFRACVAAGLLLLICGVIVYALLH